MLNQCIIVLVNIRGYLMNFKQLKIEHKLCLIFKKIEKHYRFTRITQKLITDRL